MNLIEAMQMTRVDGYQAGWDAAVNAAVKAIEAQMGDGSSGDDLRRIMDGALASAADKVRNLAAAKETP